MNFPSLSTLRQFASSPRGLLLPLILLGGLSYSCCGPNKLVKAPAAAFVQMSRAMHGTVATEYLTYISHDATLSGVQKLNRADAVGDWEFAIRQAEALLAATAPDSLGPPTTVPPPAAPELEGGVAPMNSATTVPPPAAPELEGGGGSDA